MYFSPWYILTANTGPLNILVQSFLWDFVILFWNWVVVCHYVGVSNPAIGIYSQLLYAAFLYEVTGLYFSKKKYLVDFGAGDINSGCYKLFWFIYEFDLFH